MTRLMQNPTSWISFQDVSETSKMGLFLRMCSDVHKTRRKPLTYLRGHSALIIYISLAKCISITLDLVRVTLQNIMPRQSMFSYNEYPFVYCLARIKQKTVTVTTYRI